MWSDSQIVLSWIMSSKNQKPFIANRLAEMKKLVEKCEWNYCPTDHNPADYLTRGISAKQLEENKLWMHGPNWIQNRNDWPTWTRNELNILTTISEDDTSTSNKKSNGTCPFIDIAKYSSLQKIVRITGYVIRFIRNLRTSKDKRQIGIRKLCVELYI